jgi:hypothetical protein
MSIIKKYNLFLLKEMTEFNLQRMNSDNSIPGVSVDNPQLSTNAFDKHEDGIRQAMSRINDILFNLSGTNAYKNLRSKIGLESQNIQKMKVQRIVKVNNINYDVYILFMIDDKEYWGVIKSILSSPDVQSEVFKDQDLFQTKEWIIKTKGLLTKVVKTWLKPIPDKYRLINDNIICYSVDTGKMLKMEKGSEIELIRSFDNKIIIKHNSELYNLIGDNFIYFNWWFEKII